MPRRLQTVAFVFLLSLIFGIGAAQPVDCAGLVEEALAQVSDLCAGTGRNEACYGYTRIDAQFVPGSSVEFDTPADRVPLGEVAALQTYPLDTAAGVWGVALLNVQANLPDTLPGQGVTFLLMGDATLTDAAQAQQAQAVTCPAVVSATNAINVRSGPGTDFNAVFTLQAGAAVTVTGRSADGGWLAVDALGQPGWVRADLLQTECDPAALPVTEGNAVVRPMQAFYFVAGIGQPECREVPPSSLLIESPEGYVITLTINGVEVRVASTVTLSAGDGGLRLTTLDGNAVVSGGSLSRRVPTGFTLFLPVDEDEDGNPVVNSPDWTLEFVDAEEWDSVEAVSETVLDETLDVPDAWDDADLEAFCADPANADLCADPLFYAGFAVCGDGVCAAGEYCPEDCGEENFFCGDGLCDPYFLGEDADTCAEDCAAVTLCGDYVCDAAAGEDESTCPFDCALPDTPVTICGDLFCDPDGGEDTDTCPFDCAPAGEGGGAGGFCGDSFCDPALGEDANTCPNDCGGGGGGFCGDAVCDPALGEDANTCPNDCGGGGGGGFCGDAVCDPALGEDAQTCPVDCGSPPPFCGDGACNGGEDSGSCPGDCGAAPFCGDGICNGSEDPLSCGSDCVTYCGDGFCAGGEDNATCEADCP